MPALINIVGNRYNNLIVIEKAENINGRVAWKCKCDCGREQCKKEVIVRTGDLTTGKKKNCMKKEFVHHDNFFEFKDDFVFVHCKNGRSFIIDLEDLPQIENQNFSVDSKGYPSISIKGKTTLISRFLMNPKDNQVVDHINRNPSDNRKSNLRICTQAENQRNLTLAKNNKTGVTGVTFVKNKWVASICYNYKNIHLGTFRTKEEAIDVRKEAESKYFGEYAPIIN